MHTYEINVSRVILWISQQRKLKIRPIHDQGNWILGLDGLCHLLLLLHVFKGLAQTP